MTKRLNGEGNYIARPGGRWQFRVTVDGRRFVGSGRTKAEAKSRAMQRVQVAGRAKDTKNLTLSVLLARWTALGPAEAGLRASTFDQYESLLRTRVEPVLGANRLETITARQVGDLLDEMTGAASTKRSAYAALVRLLDHAVDRGALARNVARDVRRPRRAASAERSCTPQEARKILRAAHGHRWEVAAWLSFACGMRRGEALALRWREVDLDAGRLLVTGNTTRTKSAGLVRGATKNRRGVRAVPLSPEVVAVLRDHRKSQARKRLAAPLWLDEDLVITNEIGGLVDPRNLSRAYAEWATAAGVSDTGTHLGRHFAATAMLSSGRASVADVAAVLGHDPAVLLNTYASAVSEGQLAAAGVLGAVLTAPDEDETAPTDAPTGSG
jgi:integrase